MNLASGHIPGELARELRTVAMESWRDGHHTYLEGPGLPPLLDAVVDWLDMRQVRTAEDVLVSAGSRGALAAVVSVVAGPGDVVLIDSAAWQIFHQLVAVSGATPVPCRPAAPPQVRGLKLSAADVRQQLELMPGARALVLANPVNTTAQVYDADELGAIIEVCAAHRVFCGCAEIEPARDDGALALGPRSPAPPFGTSTRLTRHLGRVIESSLLVEVEPRIRGEEIKIELARTRA